MFGMGFLEIFLILIVAIIALGPEKLPSAAVEVVKFFKQFQRGIADAKSTLDNELNIAEMKKEAEKFQSSFEEVKDSVNVDLSIHKEEITDLIEETPKKKKEKKPEEIVAKAESKKEKVSFEQGEKA